MSTSNSAGDPPAGDLSRRSFLALGAAGLATVVLGCSDDGPALSDDRRVIVIGAGPAGMTAAHHLVQRGIDVQVLEAAPTHGGRIKHTRDFADFPISLGGEWVHVGEGILDEIVNDPDVEITTTLTRYDQDVDEVAYIAGGEVAYGPISDVFVVDSKFVGSSWLDFFETYVLPGIADRIEFDTVVTAVEITDDGVTVTDAAGVGWEADQVVVTVPLKVLQRGDITFEPPLSEEKREAIAEANVWSGLKAFIEFDEAFYPAAVAFAEDEEIVDGQRLYYDAAYGQDTDANILGLFSVGVLAERYQALTDDELRAAMLAELDEAFDGAASRHYVRHIVQNWNEEPFAGAAYLWDNAPWRLTRRLASSVDGRLFFAGDAYTGFDDWSSVHAAARSAVDAVEELLG
ncbi:MAG: FAD-dependent oxidoreductase [Actinomycetota bacterium]